MGAGDIPIRTIRTIPGHQESGFRFRSWRAAARLRVRVRVRGIVAAAVAFLAGSSSACQPITQIVLAVESTLKVPSEIERVELAITGPAEGPQPFVIPEPGSGVPLTFPLTLGMTPGGNALSPVSVTAVAWLGIREVVRQQVVTNFVEGQSRVLSVWLVAACVGVVCADGATCVDGSCRDWQLPGASLPRWAGRLDDPRTPFPVVPSGGVRTVWSSGSHSCALGGKVLYCWGQGTDGQLGNGVNQTPKTRVAVLNIQEPAAVGLGTSHTCACDLSGQAFCWGRNADGQLGIGNTMASSRPARVPAITDCMQIAGGAQHTCALRRDGTVSCWGGNGKGQLGFAANGSTPQVTPRVVPNLTGVVEVHGGAGFTCARRADATIWCWGDNVNGQLGDGTNVDRATPGPVIGLPDDVDELALGPQFACVRRRAGSMRCWGDNASGQLGNGTRSPASTPVDVVDMTDAVQVSSGGTQHICAIRRSGLAVCWGGNAYGQLGNDSQAASLTAVGVVDIDGVSTLTAGATFTCARSSKGVSCWGQNNLLQLGIGDEGSPERLRPATVAGFTP